MVGLQCARKEGDFLLVGLHCDEDVTDRRGPHLPLMDLHERALSVLACKYVDEVIIGAAVPLLSSGPLLLVRFCCTIHIEPDQLGCCSQCRPVALDVLLQSCALKSAQHCITQNLEHGCFIQNSNPLDTLAVSGQSDEM